MYKCIKKSLFQQTICNNNHPCRSLFAYTVFWKTSAHCLRICLKAPCAWNPTGGSGNNNLPSERCRPSSKNSQRYDPLSRNNHFCSTLFSRPTESFWMMNPLSYTQNFESGGSPCTSSMGRSSILSQYFFKSIPFEDGLSRLTGVRSKYPVHAVSSAMTSSPVMIRRIFIVSHLLWIDRQISLLFPASIPTFVNKL